MFLDSLFYEGGASFLSFFLLHLNVYPSVQGVKDIKDRIQLSGLISANC
jgi:hypothetical protein